MTESRVFLLEVWWGVKGTFSPLLSSSWSWFSCSSLIGRFSCCRHTGFISSSPSSSAAFFLPENKFSLNFFRFLTSVQTNHRRAVRRWFVDGPGGSSFFQKTKGRVVEVELIRMLMGIILCKKLLLLFIIIAGTLFCVEEKYIFFAVFYGRKLQTTASSSLPL